MSAERELQEFFRLFPCKSAGFSVVLAVSNDFVPILESRSEVISLNGNLPGQCKRKSPFSYNPQAYLFQINVDAFDHVDARRRGEEKLTTLRAVTYTAIPAAKLEWDPHVLVWGSEEERAVIMKEGVDVLRRMRRRTSRVVTQLAMRQRFFLDQFKAEIDKNRVTNFVKTYASAFHSESLAIQLLSLWSSLEGLLPMPTGAQTRINSFAQNVIACQKKLYLSARIEALYQDLYSVLGEPLNDLLRDIDGLSSGYDAKLAAVVCIRDNKVVLDNIGELCGNNPLARQRLFELYNSSKSSGELFNTKIEYANKVQWHMHRIYRERNRIVHQADPSANVEGLILSLNAYILSVVEALVGSEIAVESSLDENFSNIRITEEATEREVSKFKKEPINSERLRIIVGTI